MDRNTEELLENIFAMDRKEVQSLKINQNTKGVTSWEIKMRGLTSEFEKLANMVAGVDLKCRKAYYSEQGIQPPNLRLSPFNRLKQSTIKILVSSCKDLRHYYTRG